MLIMENKTKELLDRVRARNDNDPDREPQELKPVSSSLTTIKTFAGDFRRPLSPMLKARFGYCGTWINAELSQNWLDLDEIENFRNDPTLTEWIGLRIENNETMPPASVRPADCAVCAYNPYELDETYLVWQEGVEEPGVWRYFGGDYNYFSNFNHYLEYIVGDRPVDDTGRTNP